MSWQDLNPDILENIIENIHDPRDILSLYNTEKYNRPIMEKIVKNIYIDPNYMVLLPPFFRERFYKLESVRVRNGVVTFEDLLHLLDDFKYSELCITVREDGLDIIMVVAHILCSMKDSPCERSFRIDRWNEAISKREMVWIGNGKLSIVTAPDNILKILIMYKSHIRELLLDGSFLDRNDNVDYMMSLPSLRKVVYLDYGYDSLKTRELQILLGINNHMESIQLIPTDYRYRVDDDGKFDEIDSFIRSLLLCRVSFDSLNELILYMKLEDAIKIKEKFPSMHSIGIRYIHYVNDDRSDIYPYQRYLLSLITDRYKKVKLFLFVKFNTIEYRIRYCRDPSIQKTISKTISDSIKDNFPSINIVNMSLKMPSLLLSRDNWLFDTYYD